MQSSLVTVFIPVYNAEKYIKESLESIINQTYKNLEILIIDDGSTDDSLKIISSYNDSRIRILKNVENKGLPYTRNKGLREAKGKYMAIMDADDISELNRIEEQVKLMELDSDTIVVTSYCKVFGGKIPRISKPPKNNEEIKISLLFSCRICNPATMINLDKIRKENIIYNDKCKVAQDYEFWTQISQFGKFDVVNKVLLNYRYGHDNISKKSKGSKEKRIIRNNIISFIHNKHLAFYGFELDDYEKMIFNKFFIDSPVESLTSDEISNLNILINKIIEINNIKCIFNKETFIKVLDMSIIRHIHYQPINIKDKVKLSSKLIVNKKDKLIKYEIFKMIIKGLITKS